MGGTASGGWVSMSSADARSAVGKSGWEAGSLVTKGSLREPVPDEVDLVQT